MRVFTVAILTVIQGTSPIVINVPTRVLLSVETKDSFVLWLAKFKDQKTFAVNTISCKSFIFPHSKISQSTRSVFKSNSHVHTHVVVSGFTVVPRATLSSMQTLRCAY